MKTIRHLFSTTFTYTPPSTLKVFTTKCFLQIEKQNKKAIIPGNNLTNCASMALILELGKKEHNCKYTWFILELDY